MLRSFNSNGLKVYSLSSGKSMPQFAQEALKNRRKLKRDAEYEHRIELIHDLEFPQCCGTVDVSPDSRYVIATGAYPPQIGIYDTLELCLKHRRGIDNEVLRTCFLEADYTKLAFLCKHRYVEFHNRGGRHHAVRALAHGPQIRIPKEGRDMKYISDHATLVTATASSELYRNGALLESWDLRTNESVSRLRCAEEDERYFGSLIARSVTYCTYSANGLKVAVGTELGAVKLYDIRNAKPLWEYSSVSRGAINCIQWVNSVNHYVTEIGENALIAWSDHRSVRVHAIERGDFVASIEGLTSSDKQTFADINGFAFFPDSGVCFVVGDQTRVGTYFIPHIGPAPVWCSFLENITEEMEAPNATNAGAPPKQQVFDEYVFVTRQQLEELSAADLIGTNMVRDYMHGFFISSKLHRRLKDLASDFNYEEYKKKKLQERIEAKRQMRVPIRQKPARVNVELAQKLEAAAAQEGKNLSKKQREAALVARAALEDERFAKIFTDENFAIESLDPTRE